MGRGSASLAATHVRCYLAGRGSVSLHPVTAWCGVSAWVVFARGLARLAAGPTRARGVRAERDRPGRQERERSGASTRPAARPDSLDLVGALGIRFLTNQGGSVSYRAPDHLTTVRLDRHQAQKLQVGTPSRETPAPPPWPCSSFVSGPARTLPGGDQTNDGRPPDVALRITSLRSPQHTGS